MTREGELSRFLGLASRDLNRWSQVVRAIHNYRKVGDFAMATKEDRAGLKRLAVFDDARIGNATVRDVQRILSGQQ